MAADWLSKGTPVWVAGSDSDGEGPWQRGVVSAVPGASCVVSLDRGGQVTVPPASLAPANPAFLDLASDLTNLSYLNEPGMLHTLRQRFAAGQIYTATGPVLVAINPFRPLPLYGPEEVQRYSQRSAAGAAAEGYEPHVFLTADQAYKQMVALQQSQSVLITGESGAGKTETTKFVMRYLAALAGGMGMEGRVLQTNPILEAFGNAKTGLNDNSSRFGRLIEIFFGGGGRRGICGARVHAYLLEKSRVVRQQPGERSFHVFYQLCRGASDAERARYGLPPADAALAGFAYLAGSGCTSVEGVDDAAEFRRVKAALHAVGIGEERQQELFSQLAAVLHLGNVRFSPLHDDAAEVEAGSAAPLQQAAALLGVPAAALAAALTTRRMEAGGERITRQLSAEAAGDNRDALAKALYAAAFSWLVAQINAALAVGKQQSGADMLSISLLDIYGFEQFGTNSFETLCINYANERLQGQFAAHMFALEQGAYEEEGIDWAHIDWADNQDCVDLIEARPPAGLGLLSLLDEECMMPRGSDATFAAKLQAAHAAHPRFGCPARAPGPAFTIRHFAGPVTYSAALFLDKNRDMLSRDLVELLAASSAPLAAALAAEMEGGAGGERRGSATVGARFREQLRDLVQRLDATRLHFVRCVKPNAAQAGGAFDPALVLHQLRCCGVLEVARIARAGYPTRYRHAEFAQRYAGLLPQYGTGPLPPDVAPADVCRHLLAHFGVDPSQFQLGRCKLFCRVGVLGRLEDAAARMQRSAVLIQSTWRMSVRRRAFLAARASAVTVQARWRGMRARAAFADLLARHRAALLVQAASRGWAARRRFRAALRGVRAVQAAWRRHALRTRAAAQVAARREADREQRAAADARRQEEETFEAIQREFGMDAGQVRSVLGLWRQHGDAFQRWHAAGAPLLAAARTASSQGGSPPSGLPPGEDSGLLLEVAAANADVAALQQRLEALQLYSQQLVRNSDDLREENRLLQRALSALQAAVDERADAAAAAHCRAVLAPLMPPGAGSPRGHAAAPAATAVDAAQLGLGSTLRQPSAPHPRYSLHADASAGAAAGRRCGGSASGSDSDTISLMSLGDVDGSVFTDVAPSPLLAVAPTPPTAPSAVRGEGAALLSSLSRELDKKRTLLDDDADFIREVSGGLSAAPGMDPAHEYERLVARYKSWKKEFKERLAGTQRAVRQLKRDERRPTGTPRSSASHGGSNGGAFSLTRLRSSSGGGGLGGGGDIPKGGGASEDGGRASRAARVLLPFKSRRG